MDKTWEELATESKAAFEGWLARHEGSIAFKRLNRDGMLEYFRQMVADGQPFDFNAEDMDREISLLTTVFEPPRPRFVAHIFEHWEEWKRHDEVGLLLVLPVAPNFTHGHEWWKRNPENWSEVLDRQPGARWTLWDKQAAEYDPEHPAHGYSLSHGFFCDIPGQHLGWQYHTDKMELRVNGLLINPMSANPSSSDPWNCLAFDVPFEKSVVQMRCRGIFTTASGMYPEDGEWSEAVHITGAYRIDQIPSVFNTVNPNPQYGKNFSARLDHVTDIPAPIAL